MLSKRDNKLAIKELSPAEFDVMTIIWRSEKEFLKSSEIHEVLYRAGMSLVDVMTYLNHLEKKGYVICDRTFRKNLYKSNVTEKDFISRSLVDLLETHVITFCDILEIAIEAKLISPDDGENCKQLLSQFKK